MNNYNHGRVTISTREQLLRDILNQTFGHEDFRFRQLDIMNSILDGHDTLAVMPTGGGKSMCYQIPALFSGGVTIVISPLISLMQDQVINLKQNGVNACYLNSSLTSEQRRGAEQSIKKGDVKLVYISPEGLVASSRLDFLNDLDVKLIAIDEAHCVSAWGHEFRKDYTRLGILKDKFPNTPILALTATADSKTRADICHQLRMNQQNEYISSFDRPNIKYMIFERTNEVLQLDQFIKTSHVGDTGIVYCLSRKKVERVTHELKKLGHNAVSYHAGLPVEQRENAQHAFNRDESIIVVATIAFGMGIDRPDVRFVAHLDLPKSIEGYYQETGRAGRDGKEASAWMIYGLQDIIKLSQMLETTDAHDSYKKVARAKLDSMLALCETASCRRKSLLGYFEESLEEDCGYCDTCLDPGEVWDAMVDAQKVLSTIYKTGQFFGAGHVIDVLMGSQNAKVKERGHDKLSVHGIGKDQSKNHWNSLLRQLLGSQNIFVKNWDYKSLALTQKSSLILKGEVPFMMRRTKEVKINALKAKKLENIEHDRHDLFEELRSLRREIADDNNVPPYVVFGDKSLHDMCMLLPRNKSEFLMVSGVGAKKCDQYSEEFLHTISSHIT